MLEEVYTSGNQLFMLNKPETNLKKQRHKLPLMGLEIGDRFINDAFLPVQFSSLSSSIVIHFAGNETTFTN